MKRLVFSVFGIVCCLTVFGQSKSKLDSTQHVHEVVVVSKTTFQEVIPSQQLSGEQLEKLNTHSVADALRYFSGLQVKDYGGVGGLKTVNIRSMGTNHLGVFYDGIELGNAQNGTIDLGKFSLDNMESITLYNGEKNSSFQSAKDFGASGNVYMQSKAPFFETGEKYHMSATLKAGSFWTVNPSFVWEQKLTDKLSLSSSVEYLYTTS